MLDIGADELGFGECDGCGTLNFFEELYPWPERITALGTRNDGTLVAGGSVGPELLDRHARFWRSGDNGSTWTAVPDQEGFDGTEVTAIIPVDEDWLALGRIGNGQRTTGSLTWA